MCLLLAISLTVTMTDEASFFTDCDGMLDAYPPEIIESYLLA